MIDFKKMREVAEKMEKAGTEERLDILRQVKHEYILGLVSFVCLEYEDHRKRCEEETCDFCESMLVFLEGQIYSLRIEAHANIIMNFTVKGHTKIWPLADEEMEKAINELIPQIRAQIAQGNSEGIVKLEREPPKGKTH